MQKVYCYVDDINDNDDEEPIIIFETCCLPRVNETMLLRGRRYLIKRVYHRIKEERHKVCKHEIVLVLEWI